MADYTATSSMTLEAAITAGSMADGENLTINNSAVITCTETPSILLGQIDINDGKLLIDGTNISSGNVINFVGENSEEINVNYAGEFEVTGDWYSIGTTDGTDSQTFDLSTYWGSEFEDAVPAIWVETGRRIYFDNASGTTPEIGDWVSLTSDNTVTGRIIEVNETSSYLVVKFLTGSLSDNDAIEVRKTIDNSGPSLELTWSASVNNASGDILEDGVYQEFANTRSNGSSTISYYGTQIGGFVFDHVYQSNTITMGSSSGGFVPPSGCDVRIPNVHFSTSTTTAYASSDTAHPGSAYSSWYELSTTAGGSVSMSICNLGIASFASYGASAFTAEYVGSCVSFGNASTQASPSYTNCVIASDPYSTTRGYVIQCWCTLNVSGDITIDDCLFVRREDSNLQVGFQNVSSATMSNTICVYTGSARLDLILLNYSSGVTIDNCVSIGSDNAETRGITFTSCTNCLVTNYIYSASSDHTATTQNNVAVYFQANSTDIKLAGMTVLGTGIGDNGLFYLYNVSDIKIRAVGSIDKKIDFDTTGTQVIYVATYASNIDMARIWTDNAANYGSYPYRFTTALLACNGMHYRNCSASYTAGFYAYGNDNILLTGMHSGNAPFGSYNGLVYVLSGCYGRQVHDGFLSDTTGFIGCLFVGPSNSINNVTIVSGSPVFLNTGSMNMASGDQFIVEQDYYSLGHTGFSGGYTANSTGASWGDDEWSNVDVDFQYDLGSGYNGTWLDARTSSNLTSISGTTDGVKLKFRFTATGTQNGMSAFSLHTTTTLSDQLSNLHPIDQDTVSIRVTAKSASDSSLIENAMVYLIADSGGPLTAGTVIFKELTNSSGYVEDTNFLYSSNQPVTGWVRKSSPGDDLFVGQQITGTVTSSGLSITAVMIPDE